VVQLKQRDLNYIASVRYYQARFEIKSLSGFAWLHTRMQCVPASFKSSDITKNFVFLDSDRLRDKPIDFLQWIVCLSGDEQSFSAFLAFFIKCFFFYPRISHVRAKLALHCNLPESQSLFHFRRNQALEKDYIQVIQRGLVYASNRER